MSYDNKKSPLLIPTHPRAFTVDRMEKPRCFDHGCNGREFLTFSDLFQHQRERLGTATNTYLSENYPDIRATAYEHHANTSILVNSPHHDWTDHNNINMTDNFSPSDRSTEVIQKNMKQNLDPPVAEMIQGDPDIDTFQDMSFSTSVSDDVLEQFDLDSFLQDKNNNDGHEAKLDRKPVTHDDLVVPSPSTLVINFPQVSLSILADDRGSETENTDKRGHYYSPATNMINMEDYKGEKNTPSYERYSKAPKSLRYSRLNNSNGVRRRKAKMVPFFFWSSTPVRTHNMEYAHSGVDDTDLIGAGGHQNFRGIGTEEGREVDKDLQEQQPSEVIENTITSSRPQSAEFETSDEIKGSILVDPQSDEVIHAFGKKGVAKLTQWNSVNQISTNQLADLALEHTSQAVGTGQESLKDAGEVSHGMRTREEGAQILESMISAEQNARNEGESRREALGPRRSNGIWVGEPFVFEPRDRILSPSRRNRSAKSPDENDETNDVAEESLDTLQADGAPTIEEVNIIRSELPIPEIRSEGLDKFPGRGRRNSKYMKLEVQELHATAEEELNATEEEKSRAKGELFKLLKQWTTCDPSIWTAEPIYVA